MKLSIRCGRKGDAALILSFVKELATYEDLLGDVSATEEALDRDFFGENPQVFCEIAELEGKPVGMAVWFYNYSAFRARHGIWMDLLCVLPSARGTGVGKALVQRLASRCHTEKLDRFEWVVLDWNAPAIDFYVSLGARLVKSCSVCRFDGEALQDFGK